MRCCHSGCPAHCTWTVVVLFLADFPQIPARACFQNWNGIAHAMHLVVSDEVPMETNLRYRMPEPLWKRFKSALDRVGAETAGAEALAAPGPSSQG